MLRTLLTLQKPHIPASFNMYLIFNKCVTPVKVSNIFQNGVLRTKRIRPELGRGYRVAAAALPRGASPETHGRAETCGWAHCHDAAVS
jgi:hypothetical protein